MLKAAVRGCFELCVEKTQPHRDSVLLTGRLVVVDVDPVQLKSGVTHVVSRRVDAVLIADHLPKLIESQQQ